MARNPMLWMFRLAALSLMGLLLLSACDEGEEVSSCIECAEAEVHIAQANDFFANGDYRRGVTQCARALEAHPASSEARFCRVVGEVGRMSGHVNELLGLFILQSAPVQPMMDVKPLLSSLVQSLERSMATVDADIEVLSSVEQPLVHIPSVPIAIEVGTLGNYFHSATDTVRFDLGGTWDKTQLLLLGAGINAVQAVLDYGLAHTLRIDKMPQSTAGMLPEILVRNPALLTFDQHDEEMEERLYGSDSRKGLRNDIIAVLSYLHGREEGLEGVAGANVGLREAIRQSAASEVTEPVMKWYDGNGDGHPEGVRIEFLAEILQQVAGYGVPLFPNIFSPDTMDSFYAWLGDLMENIEDDADPVALVDLLEGLRQDLGMLLPDIGPVVREVPDLFYVDPGTFLLEPLPVRAMMPYFFASTGGYYSNVPPYYFLYETKMYEPYGSHIRYFSFASGTRQTRSDHFRMFPASEMEAAESDEFVPLPDLELADDGVRPDDIARALPYLALQSPSFGGLLWLNVRAFDGGYQIGPAGLASFNTAAARTLKYYCIDLSPFYSAWYPTEDLFLGVFADCN